MPLIHNGIFYLRNRLFKSGTLFSMLKKKILFAFAGLVILIGIAAAIYQIPAIKNRFEWRMIVWSTYIHNTVDPVGKMPTPLPSTPFATSTPAPFTPTPIALAPITITPSPTSQPLPSQVSLPDPKYELQGINNCGP